MSGFGVCFSHSKQKHSSKFLNLGFVDWLIGIYEFQKLWNFFKKNVFHKFSMLLFYSKY